MVKKISITYLFLFLGISLSMAQTHEVGLIAGVANYKGELANVINLDTPGPYGALFYRANLSQAVSFKGAFSFARISDDDANSNDALAQARNHNFNTVIIELSALIEYNFLDFRGGSRTTDQYWTPYLFSGINYLKIDPLNNSQPSYGTAGASIPLGLGLKAVLSDNVNIGFEFGGRFTFTDFLDDLGVDANTGSPNLNPKIYTGNPNNSDMYFFTGIYLSYVFPDKRKNCPVIVPR